MKCQQHPILKVLSDHEEATKYENYKLHFRIFSKLRPDINALVLLETVKHGMSNSNILRLIFH